MRYEIKRIEDGKGPYRWFSVIKNPDGLLYRGRIYDKDGTILTDNDIAELKRLCKLVKHECREQT